MTIQSMAVIMEKRDGIGQYTKEYRMDPEIAIDVFQRQQDPSRPLGSADIESILGWSRGTVHNKLDKAVEEGELATRTIGERTRVWWIPNSRETAGEDEFKPPVPTTFEEVFRYQDATYIKGRNRDYKRERAEAVYAAYNLLRRQGRVSNDELLSQGMNAYPETGADAERSEDAHWVNYLRDALPELPGVEPPPRTTSLWTYIPPGGDLDKKLSIEIEEWVPGSDELRGKGKSVDRQRAMIQLAYNYIRDEGETTQDELEEYLPPYVAHYTDFNRFWVECLKEHLPKGDWIEHGSRSWVYINPEVGRELDNVSLDKWVAAHSVPGQGDAERRQQACIQLAYEYLRDHGEADRPEIEEALPDYSSYYDEFDGLWNYVIRDAFKKWDKIDKRGKRYTIHDKEE